MFDFTFETNKHLFGELRFKPHENGNKKSFDPRASKMRPNRTGKPVNKYAIRWAKFTLGAVSTV